MDIVFKGRHTDVLERFRAHAAGKLAKIEKLDHRAIRVDVEVTAERNPRQSDRKERVELTITTRGPAIRAEAAAEDRFSALDLALAKLESRLRRSCDRRKDRYARTPSVAEAAIPGLAAGAADAGEEAADGGGLAEPGGDLTASDLAAGVPMSRLASEGAAEKTIPIDRQGDGPLVVREKTHVAGPMTLDQALFEMELVGHDFFLFTDEAAGLPSVVYKRRGYSYGVIRLVAEQAPAGSLADAGQRGAANLAGG